MKKTGILNAELSGIVAAMGHGDLLVIGDAGLPVPEGVPCIDLAVTLGVPRFAQVLGAVMTELEVERSVVARETGDDVQAWIAETGLAPEAVSHEEFKRMSAGAVAVVRTGEATAYANIALFAGVVF